jgi:hypothetical protein
MLLGKLKLFASLLYKLISHFLKIVISFIGKGMVPLVSSNTYFQTIAMLSIDLETLDIVSLVSNINFIKNNLGTV